MRSSGPLFLSVSMHSFISRELPTAVPSGWFISVIRAVTFFPIFLAMFTKRRAKVSASFIFRMKAPVPVLTSRIRQSVPSANFLLIMLEAMRGMLSTVAVTSLKAYIFLSAGAILSVCPIIAIFDFFKSRKNVFFVRFVLNPGIDSSLSSVPPVCPNPLPLIIGTGTPPAAAMGARIMDTLSPTPPVECLSTVFFLRKDKSRISPEFIMHFVRKQVSLPVIPLK